MINLAERSRAGIVVNCEFICVETYSGYSVPTYDPDGVQHFLIPDVGDEVLGCALLDALSHSRFITPEKCNDYPLFYDFRLMQEQYARWVQDLMRRYGYKTKRALFKSMMNCGIEQLNNMITITPMRHIKLEMWEGLSADGIENVVIPSTSTPAEIGAALRLAFSRCA